MKSNYRKIGELIHLVNERNKGLYVTKLLGLTIAKKFIPSVANTVGTDMGNYKIIRKKQFACSLMQVRRDKKLPVALLIDFHEAIISQAYPVFEVNDEKDILPEYLMMWFSRSEFDREACFYAIGGVRGSLEWEDFCNMELPVPDITKQQEIVDEYNAIKNRISLNNNLIEKLEDTAQTIYKQWFVDFEFPNEEGKPYKSSGGEMEYCEELEKDVPKGWESIELGTVFSPQKGKNITRSQVIEGKIPVIAGGVAPSCYHNQANTNSPVITISASGANAGFIRLYNQQVWSSDSSYIDNSITDFLYFYFVLLKSNQSLIFNMQEGTGQPHIYPEHISSIKIPNFNHNIIEEYDSMVSSFFNKISLSEKQNKNLIEMKGLILSKMATID